MMSTETGLLLPLKPEYCGRGSRYDSGTYESLSHTMATVVPERSRGHTKIVFSVVKKMGPRKHSSTTLLSNTVKEEQNRGGKTRILQIFPDRAFYLQQHRSREPDPEIQRALLACVEGATLGTVFTSTVLVTIGIVLLLYTEWRGDASIPALRSNQAIAIPFFLVGACGIMVAVGMFECRKSIANFLS